jgi:hypothetical protein
MRPQAALRFAEAHAQFGVLFARRSGLVELRIRTGAAMRQRFYASDDLASAAGDAIRVGRHTDLYVGALPRCRRGGRRADVVPGGDVVWADLDDLARDALGAFRPAPTLVVLSGTAEHRHAYWRLERAVPITLIERINQALATELGADLKAYDAGRVLRVAGTRSFKRDPAARVRIERLDLSVDVSVEELLAALPQLPAPRPERPSSGRRAPDRLRAIPPAVYMRVLAGYAPTHGSKVSCPFHDDRQPSLHLYREPERGWYCFGCGRGRSIYDLAAGLWGRPLRGADFLALRRDIQAVLDRDADRGVSARATSPVPR